MEALFEGKGIKRFIFLLFDNFIHVYAVLDQFHKLKVYGIRCGDKHTGV